MPSDRSCGDRRFRMAKNKKCRSSCFWNGIFLNLLTHGSRLRFSSIPPGHRSEANCALRWQGASYSGAHPVFVFMETHAAPYTTSGSFLRTSSAVVSYKTCPAVHLLILPARRRLPGTSTHPLELLRRRLLQFYRQPDRCFCSAGGVPPEHCRAAMGGGDLLHYI